LEEDLYNVVLMLGPLLAFTLELMYLRATSLALDRPQDVPEGVPPVHADVDSRVHVLKL